MRTKAKRQCGAIDPMTITVILLALPWIIMALQKGA